jgi:RND family efflux transporter MFP subunit
VANAAVVAPFAGTVTKINTQPGQTMGTNGVLSLVSDLTEIRLNLDESNLADLRTGQEAIISSSAFFGQTFKGTISTISPSVNQTRGTVEVKIIPNDPPEWLHPGQTVNVNIITNQSVQRLLVPQTALTRSGERTVVFVIQDGKAVEKQVVTRAPLTEGVPVVRGLDAGDRVIANAQNIKAGAALRVK